MAFRRGLGLILVAAIILMPPFASSAMMSVSNGEVSDIGSNVLLTSFGMITGSLNFAIGNFTWVPTEIWLLPQEMDPDVFSKGLTQDSVLEIPENVTFSTCRTAVYRNVSVGFGFKIYNTGTTRQISQDGTFCGLAYNGTYFLYAKY